MSLFCINVSIQIECHLQNMFDHFKDANNFQYHKRCVSYVGNQIHARHTLTLFHGPVFTHCVRYFFSSTFASRIVSGESYNTFYFSCETQHMYSMAYVRIARFHFLLAVDTFRLSGHSNNMYGGQLWRLQSLLWLNDFLVHRAVCMQLYSQ